MDRRLVEAALSGNETTLIALIHEDPLILHRISLTSFDENPLHIASLYGNLNFVTAILSRKPEFLSKTDSLGRYPLHLACAEGHVEIVKKLFQACPEVALKRDQDGRTPLELAVLNEKVDVLTYLLQENPLLAKMADSDNKKCTILHFCIRHNSIGALKLLVDCWSKDEVITSQDGNGNNLLHFAVIHKQIETVKYLIEEVDAGEKWNSINKNGFSAIDILDHYPKDWRTLELQAILKESGVRRTKEINNLTHPPSEDTLLLPSNNILCVSQEISSTVTPTSSSHFRKVWKFIKKIWHHNFKKESNWAEKIRGNLLVTATLIATISFQAGLNPPGGVWQDSNNGRNIAGTSIIASRDFEAYFYFVLNNTIALISSSGIILLMISGFPLNSKTLMALLMLVMTFTIVFMLKTYSISVLHVLTPEDMTTDRVYKIYSIFSIASTSWDGVFFLVVLLYLARFLVWFLKKISRILKAGSGLIKWIINRVCVNLPSDSAMI